MFNGLSPFSLIAAGCYGVTLVLALLAGARAGAPRARRDWWVVALLFGVLMGWRLANGEALVMGDVRGWTHAHALYDARHDLQIPVTIALLVVIALLIERFSRLAGAGRGGQALVATLALVVFSLVRMVSLHMIDTIIYRAIGPFHVNHLIDMGLTALVAGLALLEGRPKARRAGRRR